MTWPAKWTAGPSGVEHAIMATATTYRGVRTPARTACGIEVPRTWPRWPGAAHDPDRICYACVPVRERM